MQPKLGDPAFIVHRNRRLKIPCVVGEPHPTDENRMFLYIGTTIPFRKTINNPVPMIKDGDDWKVRFNSMRFRCCKVEIPGLTLV